MTVEYKAKDSSNSVWYEIGTYDLSSNYEMTEFEWNTDGLADGKYEFRAYCVDMMGNISETYTAEFTLDATAPDAPVLELLQDNFRLKLEWSASKADDIEHYRLYRKSSKNEDYTLLTKTNDLSYIDEKVEPYKNYTYKVEAYDKTGNVSASNEISGYAYDVDTIPPQIDMPEEIYGIAGEEIALDGSACTDNVRIKRFTWDMGDGNTTFGVRNSYIYDEAGEYTITLTVEDAAKNSSTSQIKVIVYEPSEYGFVNVEVTDSGNNLLSYSYIYVYSGDSEGIHTMRTGYDGTLKLCAKIGDNKIAAYKDGCLPEEKEIAINNEGDNGTVRLALQSGELVTGDLEVHRMSLEEMAEAGIDFYDPSNYHTVRFTVKLTFAQEPIPTVIEYITNGSSGFGGGWGSSDIKGSWSGGSGLSGGGGRISFTPVVREDEPEEIQPILAYVYVNQSISFMKEMYSVNLGVLNNADKQFVIEDSSAALNLPYGLSLATNKQPLTQSMGSIAGQQQKIVGWSVRGDRKGEYDLSADFKGTLMPFGAPVSASFKTSTPFTVGAGDGIVIHVMPESCAYIGEKYYVQLAVANEGSDTFYNLTTDFGPYINPGYKQYITITHPDGSVEVQEDESACYEIQSADECEYIPVISGGQHVRVKVFKPGDVIYGTYCQTFSASGDPEQVYYKLIDSVVEQLTGDTNVKVVVEPIASHITKFNVKQKIVDNSWADPVDMTTGAYTDQVPAMSVTGESPLTLNLNYNSLNASERGQLGYGWSHDFEAYLDVKDTVINVHWNPTDYSSFVDERSATRNVNGEIIDGQKYVFDSDGKLIQIIQPNEKTATLEHIGNTTVITEDVSGAKLVLNYNDSGLLTSVGDGNGRITSITYENDLIKSVTNPLGDTVVYAYDENNRLITTALNGEAPYVTNTYDEEGRVLTQDDADPDTPLSYFSYSESENNKFIVDGIDRNGNTVKYVSDGMGHLLSVTDQNNNTVKYSYDLKGNLLDETTADGKTTVYTYDDDNNLIKVKDPSGYVTVMTYDGNGNILTVTGPNGEKNSYTYNVKNLLETQTEYTSARKSYTYNKNGQILTEAIEGLGVRTYGYTNGKITSVSDYENNLSENTYDEYGNLRSQTDREGHQTVYNYDLLNRVISITNEDGTESYTYDSMGNKTSVTDSRGNTTYYTYNSNNWLISTTNAKGTVTYDYDNEGRLIRQTNTDGTVVVNTCDAVGNVISATNENGEVTKFAYDAANRMISKTVVDGENEYTESYEYYPNGKIKKTTFADGTSESYTYDKQWRLVKTTDEQGNYSTSEYDAANNLLSATDAEGNTVSYTYDKYGRMLTSTDANGNVTTYDEYDFNGLCTQKTLPNGQVVKIGYNKEGMVTQTTFVAEDENSEDISVFYGYDAMGRVTKYTNEEGYSTFTEYDENGNIIKLTDAEGNVVTSQYDEVNSLILSTDAMGVDTQYTYDSVGNLVKTIENLNTAREEKTENVYDNLGRITSSTDAESGTAKYEYDRLGNVSAQIDPNGGRTEYTYDSMGRLTETVNPIGGTKTYTYDDVGQLASQKNARGQETTYEYYKNGWIKSFTDELGTVSYTYDGNGNVLTVTDENGTITREYDNMNRVTKYTDFRGNTIKYSYDQLGNLVALTYPGGRVVRYTYYKTGNVKTVTDWDGKVTSFEYDGNGRLTKISRADGSAEERTYDANGRLVTIVDKNGENVINQKVYSYDESGNVTEISSSDGTTMDGLTSAEMKYNENNQLIEYNGEEVKYDADGNMIYGPLNGEMAEFEYDCRNRLVSAGGISYEYDAENNRISQTENGAKTDYVVDSNSSTLTRILTAAKEDDTTYYIYGIGLIAQENDGEYLIYHFNNIGSTEAVTNIDGEIVETFDYGPYGELLSENSCGIMFLYNGEVGVATDSNGLYYMRARYYNPEIKRFINQDVMTGSITNTPTLNRYAYVNGNPISLNDPFGLSPLLNWLDGITGHDVLDLLGMIPGVGFVFDGINAAWYIAEGDYFNAACSFVSALPGVGDAIGVFAKGGKACKIVTAFHKAGAAGNMLIGAYTFGNIAEKYITGEASFTWDEIKGDLFTVAMTGASMWGSAKDFGTSYCFVAGTLVTTEDGQKPIEEIEVGDRVLSENELTGEVAIKTVTETYVNETDELIHIGVNGETISATPTHPFYVDKLGWTLARSLKAGDVLVLSNGELVTVEFVQHEILENPIKVYNFEVEDFHTYFVGENGIFVHNGCGDEVGFRDMMSPEDAARYDDYWYNVGTSKAIEARDAKLKEIDTWSNTKRNDITTVVGAVDLDTGNVAVGVKSSKTYGGQTVNGKPICAEDLAVQQLGGNKSSIVMTSAIRPRTGNTVPVCVNCQGVYSKNQFMNGVDFQ
ncbi:MAG: polymorphic toxin-type HINT domain-containing protein [Ruminococcus sp.]|nr:polymorphic toxin-type HINT domain-containing protein [Ruminococcus sp.]